MLENRPTIATPGQDAIARGYEARDVSSRTIFVLVTGVFVLVAALCGGLWWLHQHYVRKPMTADAPRSAVLPPGPTAADAPPLQPQQGHESLDSWDLKAMHDREDKTFAALGWRADERTHRHSVPFAVLGELQRRQATTQPVDSSSPATTQGGR